MTFWLWGALFAFLGGTLVGTVNFFLSRFALRQKTQIFSLIFIVRQLLQIGYLVFLYLVEPYVAWGKMPLLLGGALGLTLPLIYFTMRLMKISDSQNEAGPAPQRKDGEM